MLPVYWFDNTASMTEVEAVFITGTAAALVAVWALLSQRSIACRRATVDYLSKLESDKDIIEARRKFIELAKKPGGLAPWADSAKEKSPETTCIRTYLNSFELIAIGIQRGVFDATLYKRWFKSGVLQAWSHAAPFVLALRARTSNDAIYYEFEEMARYMRGQKMPKRNWWLGKFF